MNGSGKALQKTLEHCTQVAALSYASTGLTLNLIGNGVLYRSLSLQSAAYRNHVFRVLSPTFL
jgi:hypothetical protein